MSYTNGLDDPSAHFQTALWTGDGTAGNAVTFDGNSDMQPDMVWSKRRDVGYSHVLKDTSRGGTSDNDLNLVPNLANAESTYAAYRMDFNSDGFTLDGVGDSGFQGSGTSMVSWCWKANGGSTSSNTDGTGITSTVQANQDAGFSIVTYTGIGSGNANPSVGHGLGVTPQVVLVKSRSQAISWIMYHYGIDGANSRNKYLLLDTTGAAGTLGNYWGTSGSGGVTSSTFGVYADNQSANNYLNGTHVAYCFAEKQGYSKFGKYVGNGSTNGSFIYTGFKPAVVITKKRDQVSNWTIYDNKRDPFNVADKVLLPNANNADQTVINFDFVSNGFKCRNSGSENENGTTFIYMAFAENPFTTSTGIPTTAR